MTFCNMHMSFNMFNAGFSPFGMGFGPCCFNMWASSPFFNTSVFSMGMFNQYPTYGTPYDFLLNPFLAYSQALNSNTYGPTTFGSNYSYGNFNNFGTTSFMGNGFMPGLTNTPYASSKPKTDAEKAKEKEDKDYGKKLNDLYDHLMLIVSYYTKLTSDDGPNGKYNSDYTDYKDFFDEIKNSKEKTNKEKYEALHEEYKKLKNDGIVQNYIINGKTMSISSLGSNAMNSTDKQLRHYLDRAGIERTTDADDDYEKVVNAVLKIKSGDTKDLDFTCSETHLAGRQILDIISSENSILAAKAKRAGNLWDNKPVTIMGLIKTTYDSVKLSHLFDESQLKKLADMYKTALIDLAKEYLKDDSKLDDTSKETLRDIKIKLEGMSIDNKDFANCFNELYSSLRIITAQDLSMKLTNKYNEYDKELYTYDMFLSGKAFGDEKIGTLADLESENCTCEHTYNFIDHKKKAVETLAEAERKFVTDLPFELKKTGIKVKINGKEHSVYMEPVTHRLFACMTERETKYSSCIVHADTNAKLVEVFKPENGEEDYKFSGDLENLFEEMKEAGALTSSEFFSKYEEANEQDNLIANADIFYKANGKMNANEWEKFKEFVDNELNTDNALLLLGQYNDKYSEDIDHTIVGDIMAQNHCDSFDYAKKVLNAIIDAGKEIYENYQNDDEISEELCDCLCNLLAARDFLDDPKAPTSEGELKYWLRNLSVIIQSIDKNHILLKSDAAKVKVIKKAS